MQTMMNNTSNNIIEQLKNIRLAADDKARMRSSLEAHITANQPVESPWAPILSPLQSMGRASLVAVMVLLMLGGVSLAAEDALPGDPLYGVKVNVNEPFASLTSLTPASEAQNQSWIAARRIAELETLAARGTLDMAVSNNLTSEIKKHTQSARAEIEKVSAQGEASSATSLETELLSTLKTHSDILGDLAVSNDGVEATTTASAAKKLRRLAEEKTDKEISTAVKPPRPQPRTRTSSEEVVTDISPEQTNKLLERTANRLKAAQRNFDTSYEEFKDDRARDGVEKLLTLSAEAINQAVDSIDEKDYQPAYENLRMALTYAHEAMIIVDTRRALEQTSGVTIEDLLDNNMIGSTTVEVELDSDNKEESPLIKPNSESAPYKLNQVSTTTTLELAASSTATTASSGADLRLDTEINIETDEEGDNATRRSTSSLEAYRKINDTLKRVEETLSNNNSPSQSGLLPSRTSLEEDETE